MINKVQMIKGGIAKDHRGQIRFVNDFDLSEVKRFYIIKNADTELVRGWRAHRIEQRWFYVLSGAFIVDLVCIDSWEKPNPNLIVRREVLEAKEMKVLHVPAGYGTAFRAKDPGSELLVYADHSISHSLLDDYTWPSDYFINTQ